MEEVSLDNSLSPWATANFSEESYYRARYYDSNAGRFLSEDPIGFDGGNNLYDYVANSSANSSDPLGLKRISIGTIRNDENTALNIMARPKCSQFILDTIQKNIHLLE